MIVRRGSTGVVVTIFVQDSSKATGAGLTGVAAGAAGLAVAYRGQGQSGGFTAVALSAGTAGIWSSGGWVEVDAAKAPGVYEIGIPNAALAAGDYLDLYIQGAVNMAPVPLKIDLVACDPQDGVRLGLSALPAVAAGAAGGLPLGDASGDVAANNLAGVLDVALSAHDGAGTAGAALGQMVGALAESYAAAGEPGTLAQLLYGVLAVLTNVDQSGTALTARRLDGSTAAMSFTLDNATTPTSRRRTG